MARRSLSMQGRILAAGVSVAVGGALVGLMATGDHGAGASANHTTSSSSSSSASSDGGNGGVSATPYDGSASNGPASGFPGGNGGFSAQPQTRTGGS
jgi:hypothetical protein